MNFVFIRAEVELSYLNSLILVLEIEKNNKKNSISMFKYLTIWKKINQKRIY